MYNIGWAERIEAIEKELLEQKCQENERLKAELELELLSMNQQIVIPPPQLHYYPAPPFPCDSLR